MRVHIFIYLIFLSKGVISSDLNGGRENGLRGSDSGHSLASNISQFVKPESPPAFFGIDFDETFHAKDEEVMKRNVKAFAEVKKKGHTPFFCTGRSRDATFRLAGDDFADKTGYNGYPGVYQNGTLVYDEHGNTIYSKPFSKEFIKKVCELVTSNESTGVLFFTENEYYSPKNLSGKILEFLKKRELPDPQVLSLDKFLDLEIYKVYLAADKVDFPGFTEGVDYVEKTDLPGSYDINPPGVTKAVGIMKLMEHFNVKPEDCAFIGNGDNDVEAMDLSNMSFAVGNASDEVKGHAKWRLDKSYDQGAVAETLELVYGL